jgi:hypothetical protein
MNVQMPKHRVDLSTPMLLYGTQAATARTGSRLCDKGFNLVLRNLRLEPPDQTFALIVREAQVGLRGQIGPFNIANDRRLQIASIVNAFELQHPIHGGHLRREIPEPYGSFSPDPQLLSGLDSEEVERHSSPLFAPANHQVSPASVGDFRFLKFDGEEVGACALLHISSVGAGSPLS